MASLQGLGPRPPIPPPGPPGEREPERDSSLEAVTRAVRTALGVPVAVLSLRCGEGQVIASVAGAHGSWEETLASEQATACFTPVLERGTPFVVRDARSHPGISAEAHADLRVMGCASVPVRVSDGTVVGALCAVDDRPHDWSRDDVAVLGDLALAVAAEIEARIAHDAVQRRTQRLGEQARALSLIASDADPGAALEAIATYIEHEAPELLCSILLLDDDGCLHHGAAPSLAPDYCSLIDGVRIGPVAGSCGTAAFRAEPVTVEDIAADPLWEAYRDLALPFGLRSCWSWPVLGIDDEVLGTIAVYGRSPGMPSAEQLALIADGVELTGIALRHRRRRAELVSSLREQTTLRRVATAVAGDPAHIDAIDTVLAEAGGLLGATAVSLLRLAGSEHVTAVHAWHAPGVESRERTECPLAPPIEAVSLVTLERRGLVLAPVVVNGQRWGFLACAHEPPGLSARGTATLRSFAEIAATAVASRDQIERLEAQATTDPLTRLPNHRVFHERLAAELARVSRGQGRLSIALLDLDGFKLVNDAHGHARGDGLLTEITAAAAAQVRAGELLTRLGGDELGLMCPDAGAAEAMVAVERLREAIEATAGARAAGVTVSAGVASTDAACGADELLRRADAALYEAKARGGSRTEIHGDDGDSEESQRAQAERLARGRALAALNALAKAVDAKDPSTRRHGDRVAAMAVLLAKAAGWSDDRAQLLREAGIVHDVGKIGVPDSVLLKPAALTAEERALVERHAALGAEMVGEILTPEQAAWIRHHHERADGAGYPDGLAAEDIPGGAALLGLADAWDAMVGPRTYSPALSVDEALRRCREQSGRQFTASAVAALDLLDATGALD